MEVPSPPPPPPPPLCPRSTHERNHRGHVALNFRNTCDSSDSGLHATIVEVNGEAEAAETGMGTFFSLPLLHRLIEADERQGFDLECPVVFLNFDKLSQTFRVSK